MSTNVLDQAQNVQGVVSAARLRDSWSRKEANATDEGRRRLYREAIFDLEGRFPDLGDVPVGGAEAFARERGHGKGSRSPVHEGRRRAGAGKPSAKSSRGSGGDKSGGKKSGGRTSRRGKAPSTARPRSSSRPAPTPRVDRAIAQTGIPAAAGSAGSVFLSAIGVTVGLSLGYLVLSTASKPGTGSNRIGHFLQASVPGAVGNFLNPNKDILPAYGAPVGGGEANPNYAGTEEGGVPVYETPGFEKPRPGETVRQWGKRHQAAVRRREAGRHHQYHPGGKHR